MGDPNETTGNDRTIGLDAAYGLETPDDSRDHYRAWATTYESEFIAGHGYTYHEGIAMVVSELATESDKPILDIGCGTGAVGVALQAIGTWSIDGADISPEMMAIAATKLGSAGNRVYRAFLEVDLTSSLTIDSASYGLAVSAGVFTHGHLSHDALDELYRIVAPGGLFVLGVNLEHYEERGFDARFRADVAEGRITEPELRRTKIYGKASADDHAHASDEALVVIFRTR